MPSSSGYDSSSPSNRNDQRSVFGMSSLGNVNSVDILHPTRPMLVVMKNCKKTVCEREKERGLYSCSSNCCLETGGCELWNSRLRRLLRVLSPRFLGPSQNSAI